MKHAIRAVRANVRAQGALASHVADVVLYGTRPTITKTAGDANPQRAAIGVGLHTVWEGPKKILGGAPVLKRSRSA